MAQDQKMTMVGTQGYTAPEVLRGEHYGTPADVFSFAIVMSELVSLREPYSNMIKDKEGNSVMTWAQVVELTKVSCLRPTVSCRKSRDYTRQCDLY